MTADNSGSMYSPISKNSTVYRSDIANLLQSIAHRISDKTLTSVFGDSFALVPVKKDKGILYNMEVFKDTKVGWSTNAYLAIAYILHNNLFFDRILLFSDMETYDSYGYIHGVREYLKEYRKRINPEVKFYSFNLAGYGHLTVPEKETYLISGWSEKVLNFIEINEKKGKEAIKEVEAYKPFKSKRRKKRKTITQSEITS